MNPSRGQIIPLSDATDETALTIRSFEGSPAALEVFKPEVPHADTIASAGLPPSEQSPVSLAALSVAGIALDANEIVAIGQGLCRAFIGTQLRRRLNPGLEGAAEPSAINVDSVCLDSNGRVRVALGDLDNEPAAVQSIGQVLSDTLPSDTR